MAEEIPIDPRLDLPVWLEPPNWETGILEANEWQTWVGVSEASAEQRVSQRRFPRRSWDIPFRGIQFRQSLLQQMMVSAGRRRWLLPLFPYKTGLVRASDKGTRQLFGDFQYRHFLAGELVLIRSIDSFYEFELGVIAQASDAQVTLVEGLKIDWPVGTEVSPLRVSRLMEDGRGTLRSSQVLDTTLRFLQETPEPQTTNMFRAPLHPLDRLPILGIDDHHNWRETPTISYQREVFTLDNQQSMPSYYDAAGQSQLTAIWQITTYGRAELEKLRSTLHYLRGQQNIVWLPTLSDDLQVVEAVVPAEGEITVRRVGLAQYGADRQDIKRDMLFEMADGKRIFARMVSARTEGNTERIVLADNLEVPYEAADFLRVSFLVRARLASDNIEIQHHTDVDGVQETALPFVMMTNLRDI